MVFFLYTVIILCSCYCSRCAQAVTFFSRSAQTGTEAELPELLHVLKTIFEQSRTEPAIQALTPASLVSVIRTFAFVCFYPLQL